MSLFMFVRSIRGACIKIHFDTHLLYRYKKTHIYIEVGIYNISSLVMSAATTVSTTYLLHVLLTLPQINGNYISQTRIYAPSPPHPHRGYLARTCSAVVMVTPFSFSGCYFLDRIIKHLGRIFRLASKDATVCGM